MTLNLADEVLLGRPPPDEEEPQVSCYAAAAGFGTRGVLSQTQAKLSNFEVDL
jgi:hypothetical protein